MKDVQGVSNRQGDRQMADTSVARMYMYICMDACVCVLFFNNNKKHDTKRLLLTSGQDLSSDFLFKAITIVFLKKGLKGN